METSAFVAVHSGDSILDRALCPVEIFDAQACLSNAHISSYQPWVCDSSHHANAPRRTLVFSTEPSIELKDIQENRERTSVPSMGGLHTFPAKKSTNLDRCLTHCDFKARICTITRERFLTSRGIHTVRPVRFSSAPRRPQSFTRGDWLPTLQVLTISEMTFVVVCHPLLTTCQYRGSRRRASRAPQFSINYMDIVKQSVRPFVLRVSNISLLYIC